MIPTYLVWIILVKLAFTQKTIFSWHDHNNTNFLTKNINQAVDKYCGSCWAVAVASAISDRLKILRGATSPDIIVSPQELISCNIKKQGGCSNGNGQPAYQYILDNGIMEESCLQYTGVNYTCIKTCIICLPGIGCQYAGKPKKIRISNFSLITATTKTKEMNVAKVQQEVRQYGPVSCAIHHTAFSRAYTTGIAVCPGKELNHQVTIVGWGVEGKDHYWILKNTKGSEWGERGFMRMSLNSTLVGCYGGRPILEDYTADREKYQPKLKKKFLWWRFLFVNHGCQRLNDYKRAKTLLRTQDTEDSTMDQGYPTGFTWQGRPNLLTPVLHYAEPFQCGSCWAIATLAALSDRINIRKNGTYPQVVLHHISASTIETCNCSSPSNVYEYASQNGLIEDGCQPYIGFPKIDKNKRCYKCRVTECHNLEPHNLFWNVTDYGIISEVSQMKYQIMNYGPISCGIMVTQKFVNYKEGIFEQQAYYPFLTHEVAVVGWQDASDDTPAYWICKNTWGTKWGEDGFFRIRMLENNLGIESQCSWGTPELKQ